MGDHEESPDVVTGILQVLYINVYALLYPGATLLFVTPLVARKFKVLPDVLMEPFSVTTTVGDSVMARRVLRSCPISLPNRVTLVDLVELDMVDLNVILGKDWVACFFCFY